MFPDSIGKRIKDIRIANHITQEEFARSINKNVAAVTSWESEKYLPGSDTLIEISKKYQINLNWLLLGESRMNKEKEDPDVTIPDDIKKGIFRYPELSTYIRRYMIIKEGLNGDKNVKIKWNIEFD